MILCAITIKTFSPKQVGAVQMDLIDVLVFWQEEDPGWYSRVPEFNPEPVVDIQMHVSHAILPSFFCGQKPRELDTIGLII